MVLPCWWYNDVPGLALHITKTYTLALSDVGSTGLPTTTSLFALGAEVEDGFLHRYTKKTTIATSKRPKGIPKPKPKARGR